LDQIDLDRSISPNRPNSDASSKRSRIQAVFLSRSNAIDKKGNSALANSVGVLSHPTNNTSGPGGGTNGTNDVCEHPNVVATLSQHASAAMPVASLVLPSNKVQTTNQNSTSSSAKQFLIRRVRSHSKSDPQSVPDKSLFSRFFPKKTKKPLPTLLTTTTKSIDTHTTINHSKKRANNNLLTTDYQPSNNYEEDEDDEFDDRTVSMGSLSDTDQQTNKDNRITGTQSSNITRGGSRTNSGSGKMTSAGPNALSLPTSDSQYYASMSSAPTGFSISYHKRMSKGNDDLRIQAALGRLQQQSKQGTANGVGGGGTSQLMVCQFLSKRNVHISLLFLVYSVLSFIVE
jgi:hypothetical protein